MSSYDIISLVIAFIALILAAVSLIYTAKNNRYDIRVSDPSIEALDDVDIYRLSFSLLNNSTRSLAVKNISFSSDGHRILPVQFDIEHYYKSLRVISEYEYPSDLSDFVLSPYESTTITVYVRDTLNCLTMTLFAEHKVRLASATKVFTICPTVVDTE